MGNWSSDRQESSKSVMISWFDMYVLSCKIVYRTRHWNLPIIIECKTSNSLKMGVTLRCLLFSGIGAPVPGQQFIVSPQFIQGSGPDQTAGWGGD